MRRCLALLLLLGLFSAGCAENQLKDPPITEPEFRVFYDNYDEVWRSVQLALRKYPVRVNNIESGILETEYLKNDKLFAEPNDDRFKPGMRYKITIRAVKGKIDGRTAVKVLCTKTVETQPDFFTGYRPISSNGLEEKTILYRVGRFLEMERILTTNGELDRD